MRVEKENKRRLCVMVSDAIDNRLEADSVKYGIAKSDIVRVALIDYFRRVDNNSYMQ